MTGLKPLVAAALVLAIAATTVRAEEPAAFQAQYPDRDVLNRGELTPAGRLGLENPGGAASSSNASIRSVEPATVTVAGRRHRQRPR